jgi:DNA mismatch repair protein MutS
MSDLTPMLQQYYEIKNQHQTELLLFRLGDFYEMFGEDAKEASKILDIVLTARGKGTPNEMPMCGIPFHALDNYLIKLLKAGKRVAICDQMSDPTLPGIVKREVTRVITPGTTLVDATLNAKSNNFICSLFFQKKMWGLGVADLTTGEFKTAEIFDFQILKNELFRLNPAETIITADIANNSENAEFLRQLKNANVFELPKYEEPRKYLLNHFNVINLASFGIDSFESGVSACANLLGYLKHTQKTNLPHITGISRYNFSEFMALDEATIRNLEIFQTAATGSYHGSLLSVIDRTSTTMAGRLLRRWILMPLVSVDQVNQRLDAVAELKADQIRLSEFAAKLETICDLERLMGRIGCKRGSARDLASLKNTLNQLPSLKQLLEKSGSHQLAQIRTNLTDLPELSSLLEKNILDEPAALITEGGMIKTGVNAELDELRAIATGGKDWLAKFQTQEIERSGINSLKVRFNSVFGYYIEISKANLTQVPIDYVRKQTLVNAERFITPELKEHEEKILGAEEKINALEYKIFQETVDETIKYFPQLQRIAEAIATLDVLCGFAFLALESNYCRPVVDDSGIMEIKSGRHPVIESFQREKYVANDLLMDHSSTELILLTGPNMSGKSSFLRQVALISLLAQIGSFVPAESARLGIVDRIFTRVGASDNLSQGISTFMAEMQEAANILNNATDKSLIILDELGRGTSTYDGVSIAWAIIEYLHEKVKAKTIFATHYHELTDIVEKLSRGENYCVAVSENDGRVVFLHKIIKGATSKSYGIEVAKLAGLPVELTNRAGEILIDLENKKEIKFASRVEQPSLPIFSVPKKESEIEKEIEKIDLNNMTPMEALMKLTELQKKLKKI